MSKYEKVRDDILKGIQQNLEIGVDTNLIIEAALESEFDFLQQLKSYKLFKVAKEVQKELYSNSRREKFSHISKVLKDFADAMEGRTYGVPDDDLVKELFLLVPLLPRSVATFAVVNFIESLLGKFRANLNSAATLNDQDLTKFAQEYQKGVKNLKNACEAQYFRVLKQLNIEEFDESEHVDEYFEDLENKLNAQIANLQRTVASIRSIRDIIEELSDLKQKMYTSDMRIVASSIENGVKTGSMDSDVDWLFIFHSFRHK